MTTVYCVRHGQSVSNAGGLTMAHADIPLSPLGVSQAAALPEIFASVLKVQLTRVLASSYVRALQTAQPFGERFAQPPEVDPLLHEFSALDANLLQGLLGYQRRPLADAYWQAADPALRAGPDAETFLEFDARVEAFVTTTLPSLRDGCVLVGHGIWFALLFWQLTGCRVETSADMLAFQAFRQKLPMPNCAVYALDKAGRRWRPRLEAEVMQEMAALPTLTSSMTVEPNASARVAFTSQDRS